LIETPHGKRILIDPWTMGNPACPGEYKTVESLGVIDLVLITHIHNDHVGDAVEIIKANTGAFTVCVPEVAGWLQSKGLSNLYPMNIGGSLRPAGSEILISMTQAFHTSSFNEDDGTIVHGGVPVGFVVEMENGFTIYAAGDTGVFGDMALIKEIYNPDLALLPIGDNYTMGPRTAAIAMRLLGAKYVIPIHYATFPVLTGTPAALREYAANQSGTEILALAPGETVR
jgi:L-ascorbate metabolism protein UlaG (beta-lactamase superfamily)